MKIEKIRTIWGPNIYHSRPVMVMQVDLEQFSDIDSSQLPQFKERLLKCLPGLGLHHCSPGRIGGFVERLDRGTYFGHIVEHVALEMSELAHIPVFFGKTVYAGREGLYNVIVRFKSEKGMHVLLEGAAEIVEKLFNGADGVDIDPFIRSARRAAERSALGPTTKAIVEAADQRGIPWRRIGDESLIQFGYGKAIRRIQAGVTDRTALISADMVQDKDFTKKILAEANAPFPESRCVSTLEGLAEALESIEPPWAMKPFDGHHGQGVVLNLRTTDEAIRAFEIAKTYSDYVLVEKMCVGRDYRILVIGGKLTAAAERHPAHVVGNGHLSIQALIDETNQDPRRGDGHGAVLTKIEVDELLRERLEKQNLSLDSVPSEGTVIVLRDTANLSTGGTATDVTDLVHPGVRSMCERVARFTGLDICGIDFMHSDIAKPLNSNSAIIEVNAGPGLRMHVAPTQGQPRDVGGAIIDMIYPKGSATRIPITAITGTNGKTTTTRLIGHLLSSQTRKVVGMTSSDGVTIGSDRVSEGDTTGPLSAQLVLSDPSVEMAVLETARGGLMRGGLAYDWSDVGVITNIRPDHLGQDGIEDLEDVVRVKSLIAEQVREGGTLVLNADDPETSRLMTRPRLKKIERRIVYYSLNSKNEQIERHVAEGGTAFAIADGQLVEITANGHFPVVPVEDMSFTVHGTAMFQVSNALAAAGAVRALGLSREQVARGLSTFESSAHNSGRTNIYKVNNGYLMLDYGHNTDAIEAVGQMVSRWRVPTTAIIGLPGDRDDKILKEASERAARFFSRIIARDDRDLRGRRPLEIPSLIERAVKSVNRALDVTIIEDEAKALEHAISTLRDEEVVILFYDVLENVLPVLKKLGAVPIEKLPAHLISTARAMDEIDGGEEITGEHHAWAH